MSGNDRSLLILLAVIFGALLLAPGAASAAKTTENSCVHCHAALPGNSFVGTRSHSWTGSVHEKHGVTCDKCHGGDPKAATVQQAHTAAMSSRDPKSPVYFKNIPKTCGKCHGAEFYKFTQSIHYQRLESAGRGPECVTCHGSMVTTILTPDTLAAVCEQCHNERMGIFPYVPQKAKAVLLLLRESSDLLDAKVKLLRGKADKEAFRDARTALHSAKLDWHRFDLDTITADLQKMYDSLEQLPAGKKGR